MWNDLSLDTGISEDTAKKLDAMTQTDVFQKLCDTIGNVLDVTDVIYAARASFRSLSPSYVPDELDLLHLHWSTTGVTHSEWITPSGAIMRTSDVGGRISERRKWSMEYEKPWTRIIFVVAADSFCQSMFEDPQQNRMTDALKLFGEVCNDPKLHHQPKLLILNKLDLFRIRLKSNFDTFIKLFPDYKDACEVEFAIEHIKEKFLLAAGFGQGKPATNLKILVMSCLDTTTSPLRDEFDSREGHIPVSVLPQNARSTQGTDELSRR